MYLKTHFAFFVLATSFLLVVEEQTQSQEESTTSLGPQKTELPEAGVEVDMQFRGNMPALDVMVNEKGPFFFAIDSGGMGAARADKGLIERLGLIPTGEITAGDGSGVNNVQMKVYEFTSIGLGSAKFSGVSAPSRDYNRSPLLKKIDGILGFHLFQDGLLTIDYPNKKIRFEPGELPPADGKTIFDTDPNDAAPSIKLNLAGNEAVFHLDTGNMGGVTVSQEWADKLKFAAPLVVVGEAATVANRVQVKQGQLADSLFIGTHELVDPVINVIDLPMDPNIGSRVLMNFALTFDQQNNRVRITRPDDAPIRSAPRASVGIAMANRNGQLSVARVLPDSAAESAGLKPGDQIRKLNGIGIEELGAEQIRAIMTSGNQIRFHVQRDDEVLEIAVQPKAINESD